MVKPITPEEAIEAKRKIIPDIVYEKFNELIVKNWSNATKSSKFTQAEIVSAIEGYPDNESVTITRSRIFDERMLDVEDVYRDAGWSVLYDKPSYDETYDAFFKFATRKV